MLISYGIKDNNIDVTDICLSMLTRNNIIIIPSCDHNRAALFTDPLLGTLKSIFISVDNENSKEFDETYNIKINIIDNTINLIRYDDEEINNKILNLQSKLTLKYGNLDEELPEQKMAARYLTGKEKVLEIGGNIGRNSLIIASIVENNNFLTLESDLNIANQLIENRDLNNFNFYIESAALSNRKLIQKGWDTIPSDTLQDGYKWVNTVTSSYLKNKYNIEFDTLILDCEGAFYYILMDMPEILDNIKLIIMENDYYEIFKKQYVDKILKKKNFYRDYVEAGGWGPCINCFFEVWKKN